MSSRKQQSRRAFRISATRLRNVATKTPPRQTFRTPTLVCTAFGIVTYTKWRALTDRKSRASYGVRRT